MIKSIFTYCFILLLSLTTWSQADLSFSLTVKKNSVHIGDPIYATLQLSSSNGSELEEVVFPYFTEGESLNDTIDVWSISEPSISSTVWKQDITFAAFWGGNTELGPFEVEVNGVTITSNTVTLQVFTPEVDLESQFKGIKPIYTDSFTFWELIKMWLYKYWILLICLVLIVTILGLGRRYYIRKKNQVPIGPVIPVPVQLMNQLIAVENQELWQKDLYKAYYTGVTDVIRKLIEYKFEISAMEKTSHEILSALRVSSIDKSELRELNNLFELADIIKFAKSTPLPEENKKAMDIAKILVNREVEAKK